MDKEENIKVLIRIRPNLDVDGKDYLSKYKESNSIVIPSEFESKTFSFDEVEDGNTSQEVIFLHCKSLFQSFFSGYNCTIFAYGQTSSGKTYTMTGSKDDGDFDQDPGLVPRGLQFIFDQIHAESNKDTEYLVKCSFVEIYNEQLFDLLDPKGQRVYLKVNLSQGVYVDKLTEKLILNTREALSILQAGLRNRHVGSTAMNRESSRSHAVFSIILESSIKQDDIDNIRKSVLHMVDLAGSERQRDTKSEGTRLKEAGSINKSLHVLGQVISSHVDVANGKKRYIRYRESKLTQLLKDSIGGNSKTFLVACVHPDIRYMSETLSTLQFASHVKMIKNKAKVNIDVCGNVESLQREVLKLRERLESQGVHELSRIQPNDYDCSYSDSVWKRRFIQVMTLRTNQGLETCNLRDQLELNYKTQVKLEEIIENLKNESQIKENKIQRIQRSTLTKVEEDEILISINKTLSCLTSEVSSNIDRVKMDILQSEVNSLRTELLKAKNMQSLALSDAALLTSIFKEYNDIIDSRELGGSLMLPNTTQLEVAKLNEELSVAKITISELKRKNATQNSSHQEERRKLESEIASMKSLIRDNHEKEKQTSKRRQTLFNFIRTNPTSPIRKPIGIKTNTRAIYEVDELNDSLGDFQPSSDFQIDTLTKELAEAQAEISKCQIQIGKLEYDNREYMEDIKRLQENLKDQEALETEFIDLKLKYNEMEIHLREYQAISKKFETQLNEEEKLRKTLNEKISNLKNELDEALSDNSNLKDEVVVVKSSMNLLRAEIRKRSDYVLMLANGDDSQEEATNTTSQSNITNEEISNLKEELFTANEMISSFKATESEYIDQINDLEKRIKEQQMEIEEHEKKFNDIQISNLEILEGVRLDHQKEINALNYELKNQKLLYKETKTELDETKAEFDLAIEKLEQLKKTPTNGLDSPSSTVITSPQSQNDKDVLLEELLISLDKLDDELTAEKEKTNQINKILEEIFSQTDMKLELCALDNIRTLEAQVVSQKKDLEDFRLIMIEKNEEISTQKRYISELSSSLKIASEQRNAIKQHNDELINSYGHMNYKQKIKILNKLRDDLFTVRSENVSLSNQLNKLNMSINQCDPAIRNMILRRARDSI